MSWSVFIDIFLSVFIILVYYYLMVAGRQELVFDVMATHNPYNGPFTQKVENGEVTVSNTLWKIPLDPQLYKWDNHQKIVPVSTCDGQPDGAFVRARSIDVHRYLQKHDLSLSSSSAHPSAVVDTYAPQMDYYFTCHQQKEHKLFYCPPGTFFDKHTCAPMDVCATKADGYRYAVRNDDTSYYECQGKKPVLMDCPPGQVFNQVDRCQDPTDPCQLQADGYVIEHGRDYYKICRRGITHMRYCNDNEYFHPTKHVCASVLCENIQRGTVKHEMVHSHWTYATKYTVCEEGLAIKKERCSQQFDLDSDIQMELPNVYVYDGTRCSVPRLCENVFPAAQKAVPSLTFRNRMANYEFSELYDYLHGYTCQGNQVMDFKSPHGKMVDGTSVCDYDKTKTKFPIVDAVDRYYNCTTKTTETCPQGTNVFDYGRQICIHAETRFHAFHNDLRTFKLDHLSNNWIEPRPVATAAPVSCTPPLLHEPVYNVCVDKECKHVGFLSQLGKKRRIYMNDEFMCVADGQEIRYEPYDKPKSLALDFWRQKFVAQPPGPCRKGGTRLESSDFVMNSVIYPTCSGDPEADPQFVLCPSTSTETVQGTPTLCIPKNDVLTITLLANKWYDIYSLEVYSIKTLFDSTDFNLKDSKGDISSVNVAKKHQTVQLTFTEPRMKLKASKSVQLNRKNVPTNHPDYVLNFYKTGRLFTVDYEKGLFVTNPTIGSFEFPKYQFDESLVGFK